MKENLKNMTTKNCSFPTYLVPPFRRTISQVSQPTFRILWLPEEQPFLFLTAKNGKV